MPETILTLVRLEASQLRELRRQLGGTGTCRVTNETTPHMAGYQLGMQHVLNLLAEGFTLAEAQA